MRFIKIKNIKSIYTLKIRIRNIKHLIKDTIYVLSNGLEFKKIFGLIKNRLKENKIQFSRDRFYKDKTFNHGDWFSFKIPLLINYFDSTDQKNFKQMLEIGSWEGRSSCFFLKYFDKSSLTCVDTWKGSTENFVDDDPDMNTVEKNFDNNTNEFKERVIKHKLESKKFFEKNNQKFDFIYIDGSHQYDDVLNDGKEGFKILKENGYMLFDDYVWNFYKNGKNPIEAINLFIKLHKEKIKIIYVSSQLLLKKIN